MTTGELTLILVRTGLSQAQTARLCNVTPRTVNRWATGKKQVQPACAERLHALLDQQTGLVQALVEQIEQMDGMPDSIPVLIYRAEDHDPEWTGLPFASAHLAVARMLADLDLPVEPILFDPVAYAEWLNTGNPAIGSRKDDKEARAEWAAYMAEGPQE